MQRIAYIFLIALVLLCSASKKNLINGNEELINIPCSSIVSDEYATRALGTANSTNMQNAKNKAVAAARSELASSMQTVVQRVVDSYATSFDGDTSARFLSYTQDVSRLTTNHVLVGSTIACEKITKSVDKKTKSVTYHAYVVVEVANEEIEKATQLQVLEVLPETDVLRQKFRESIGM